MILNVFQFFTNISNLSNESQLLGLTNYQNVLEHPLLQGMFKNIVILLWPLLDFPLPAYRYIHDSLMWCLCHYQDVSEV